MSASILSVVTAQAPLIVGLLLFMGVCQLGISLPLRLIFGKQLTFTEYLTLSLTGWLLPAAFIAVLWLFLRWIPAWAFCLFLVISLLSLLILFRHRFKPQLEFDSKPTLFFLLGFFFVSLLVRLAFLSQVTLPSYFDSAAHYQLIKAMVNGNSPVPVFSSLSTNYYHLGYHSLAAFLTVALQAEIPKVMLVLGQLFLALLPLSVFPLIKHVTRSNIAGSFAVIVAAFGWYMPAHAVDWGKYPALTSLTLMPFVLSLAYLTAQHHATLSKPKRGALYLLLALALLTSGFMHSRSLVIYGIVFAAWMISTWQQKLSRLPRAVTVLLVLGALIAAILYIQQQTVLTLVFDPYSKSLFVTVLVIVCAIFAQRSYPQLTFTALLTSVFLLGSLFIPVLGLVPGHANLTLLDRPYVELLLFLPLACVGGWGLAGLEIFLHEKNIRLAAGLVACSAILVYAYFNYDPYPAACCIFAGQADVTAMEWIATQQPANARIGISATELKVLPSGVFEGYVGGDAGIWITPLTDRATLPVRYDTNFAEPAAHTGLCQQGIQYLYVGSLGQPFDVTSLNAQPAWYQVRLSMPEVQVYEVLGCQ